MSTWIRIGEELGNNFNFKLSTDYNNDLKMKFIEKYVNSSYRIILMLISVVIFGLSLFFIMYFLPLENYGHLSVVICIFALSVISLTSLMFTIYNLKNFHCNIYSNKLISFTVEKRDDIDGSYYVLLHKVNDEEQFNPINTDNV
jgi:hypothetical protein